jgi:hypothetical protein
MKSFIRMLLLGATLLAVAVSASAQSSPHQAPQTPRTPLPGFSTHDPRPGTPGGSLASSGSNVGSNVGAGATAAPVGNDVTPPGRAVDMAEAPKTRPLLGLSRDLP